MKAIRCLIPLLAVLVTPLALHAQALDAQTGTYAGSLLHERKLILKTVNPPRLVAFKKKTKVVGFGYVPQGGARTFIRLIVPPGAQFDDGLDQQLTIDFTPDPPVFEVRGGSGARPVEFPAITVEGNAVTVTTLLRFDQGDYEISDTTTLRIKRTKP